MNRIVLPLALLWLAPATSALAQTVTPTMIERIGRADANGDGAVTRAEFLAFRSAQFQRLDRNHDGYLTNSDAPPFVGRGLIGFDIASMIEQFDANKDGRVSQAELASGPTPAFDLADTNHDQVVSEAERQAAAAAATARR